MKLSLDVTNTVYNAILASANHSQLNKDETINYFLDLDLAILGEESTNFFLYEEQIREEYHFVDDSLFYSERTKVMQKLANPYKTKYAQDKFLTQAQKNLKKYEQ